jgi:hypothetical protein
MIEDATVGRARTHTLQHLGVVGSVLPRQAATAPAAPAQQSLWRRAAAVPAARRIAQRF